MQHVRFSHLTFENVEQCMADGLLDYGLKCKIVTSLRHTPKDFLDDITENAGNFADLKMQYISAA